MKIVLKTIAFLGLAAHVDARGVRPGERLALVPVREFEWDVGNDCTMNIKVGKPVGSGSFGEVFMADIVVDGKPKKQAVLKEMDLRRRHAVQREFNASKFFTTDAPHPNIVKTYGMRQCEQRGKAYLLLEYVDGQDLERTYATLERPQKERVVAQVAIALAHMHEHKWKHGDLKLENVMMNRVTEEIKLIDLGFSERFLRSTDVSQWKCGTLEYMAPEIIAGSPYTFSVDVWALGVFMCVLFYGRFPFSHRDSSCIFRVSQNIRERDIKRYLSGIDVGPQDRRYTEIILKLLNRNFSEGKQSRPTMNQVIGDEAIFPWIMPIILGGKSFDFDSVVQGEYAYLGLKFVDRILISPDALSSEIDIREDLFRTRCGIILQSIPDAVEQKITQIKQLCNSMPQNNAGFMLGVVNECLVSQEDASQEDANTVILGLVFDDIFDSIEDIDVQRTKAVNDRLLLSSQSVDQDVLEQTSRMQTLCDSLPSGKAELVAGKIFNQWRILAPNPKLLILIFGLIFESRFDSLKDIENLRKQALHERVRQILENSVDVADKVGSLAQLCDSFPQHSRHVVDAILQEDVSSVKPIDIFNALFHNIQHVADVKIETASLVREFVFRDTFNGLEIVQTLREEFLKVVKDLVKFKKPDVNAHIASLLAPDEDSPQFESVAQQCAQYIVDNARTTAKHRPWVKNKLRSDGALTAQVTKLRRNLQTLRRWNLPSALIDFLNAVCL